MKLIKFPEVNAVFAEYQPEYLPFPCHKVKDGQGTLIACWELSDEEIEKIKKTKQIWHEILTFNEDLQPQLLTVDKPEMGAPSKLIYG